MRISDWSSDVCSSDLVARDRRLEPVVGGVIDERTADGVIDVALHEGRVAEHAEVAQRIREDREGQLQRQTAALQAGAGTVAVCTEFELAIGIAAIEDSLIVRRPRRHQRHWQPYRPIYTLERGVTREAVD